MVPSILLTVILVGLLIYSINQKFCELSFHSIRTCLQKAISDPLKFDSIIMLAFFCAFLLLPLFWGLAFYLKTDANVVVMLVFMAWCYNWIKHVFFNEIED